MPLLGQASGGWTESSSALRLLNVNVRNSIGVLVDDAFTQSNPPAVNGATTNSTRVNTTKSGILSGSVCFVRPDAGENYVGGPGNDTIQLALRGNFEWAQGFRALGCFINSANGNPYENTPGVASGVGPYVSGCGTFGNAVYETQIIAGGNPATASDIHYYAGASLVASRNGYLMPRWCLNTAGNAMVDMDLVAVTAESYVMSAVTSATPIGLLKMAPDPVQTELVFDQRI